MNSCISCNTSEVSRLQIEKKIRSCWLGKMIGGTLGGPYEGQVGPLNLDYFNPIPDKAMPNDDLDLQILWAKAVSESGFPVRSEIFTKKWTEVVGFPWDEYGVAIRNLKSGILPPASGSHDNYFIDGLGAAIRTELWACLATGNPRLASYLAYQDACVDHVRGGIYAAMFLAAMESMAFEEKDINKLIDVGLKFIPSNCKLTKVIEETRKWCHEFSDWKDIRKKILDKYDTGNFTDVHINIPFMLVGLIKGEMDFGKSICIAVNCGQDTDCTGSTVGALLGIINGEVPEYWSNPIGKQIVISPQIKESDLPKDIDKFIEQVLRLRSESLRYYENDSEIIDLQICHADSTKERMVFDWNPDCQIYLEYYGGLRFSPNRDHRLVLFIENMKDDSVLYSGSINLPESWINYSDTHFKGIIKSKKRVAIDIIIRYVPGETRTNEQLHVEFSFADVNYKLAAPLMTTMPWTVRSTKGNNEKMCLFESTGFWMPFIEIQPGETKILSQKFLIERDQDALLMMNCSTDCQLSLDEIPVIKRSGEEQFLPAYHRSSPNGVVKRKLTAGWHRWEIAATMPITSLKESISLHVGIAEAASQQWIIPKEWAC